MLYFLLSTHPPTQHHHYCIIIILRINELWYCQLYQLAKIQFRRKLEDARITAKSITSDEKRFIATKRLQVRKQAHQNQFNHSFIVNLISGVLNRKFVYTKIKKQEDYLKLEAAELKQKRIEAEQIIRQSELLNAARSNEDSTRVLVSISMTAF